MLTNQGEPRILSTTGAALLANNSACKTKAVTPTCNLNPTDNEPEQEPEAGFGWGSTEPSLYGTKACGLLMLTHTTCNKVMPILLQGDNLG